MKKILTKEEIEQKEKRNKILLGVALIFLMVISTIGYALFSSEKNEISKINYNNFEFVFQKDGFWHTEISGYDFYFVHNPKETENITSFIALDLRDYINKPLYFSHDSNKEGVDEIVRNLGRFVLRTQFVCLDDCEEDFPIKNCSDNIILIRDANISLIKQEDNCVYILSNAGETLKASDAFIFKILGIQ